ncbi:chloride channel protein [Suttonella ornithocola]|uniref:Putative ion channel protein n=1 Tax=Suttonella ornithocola TaxID=279832 RepID=A0A380MRR8_9GAMM|nr:chloride channel protein [Suttonella ornithocola]SUO94027.1 putative ion channel protein [Suttonella ornithocola]
MHYIGPEAGLLAVVAECSALIGLRLKAEQKRLLADVGAVAALSGLYVSPPGVAVWVDDPSETELKLNVPLVWKLLAGIFGMAGFWLVHRWLTDSTFHPLPLPEYSADGSAFFAALPAVLVGIIFGKAFVALHHTFPLVLKRLHPQPIGQILIGSAAFALLAAAVPLLRFSGHHELEHALAHSVDYGAAALMALAAGKILATNLCLASGWRGGEIFPVIFAATAIGAAVHQWLPVVPLTVAVMGAAGAMCVMCMGRPLAVMLILLLISGGAAPDALFCGVLLGYLVKRMESRNHVSTV